MRSELHLSAGNLGHLPAIVLELYVEMQRIFKYRHNETYIIDVVSDDGRLTFYSFKMWSPNILRFISQMSARHRYLLAIVLEAEFKQKEIDQFLFYPNERERPVLVKRKMDDERVTFILSLANRS